MKKAALIVFAVILLFGCIQHVKLGKPEIRGITNEWGKVTNNTTEILTKIKVYNPNPISLPLKDVLTEIYLNNIKMGEGSAIKAELKANSESTIVISTKLENDKIPEWWVSHIKNGEKSVMIVKGYLVFDLMVTQFKYPIEIKREIKTNILSEINSITPKKIKVGYLSLTIKSIKSEWGEVNENVTQIVTSVIVHNDNSIPIPITRFNYLLEMNGIAVAEGSNNVSTILKPNADAKLRLVTEINNKMLEKWWVSHIRNGEKTKVKILLRPEIKVDGKVMQFTLAEKEFEFATHLLS